MTFLIFRMDTVPGWYQAFLFDVSPPVNSGDTSMSQDVKCTAHHVTSSHRIMSPRLDTPKRHPSTSREFLPPNARCWTRRRRGRRPQPQLAMDSRHVYMSHFGKKSIYLCISCLIVSPLIVFLGKPHMIYVGFLSHVATPSLIHSF